LAREVGGMAIDTVVGHLGPSLPTIFLEEGTVVMVMGMATSRRRNAGNTALAKSKV